MRDTICAISTASGSGGIAIIRLSGEEALSILRRAIPECGERDYVPRMASLVHAALDDLVITRYAAPHSYTGEDTIEIACHGSLYIQQEILRRLMNAGARLARAGEFTQRAFVNGKMDLTEAEAVADLIASESEAEQKLALRQLRGGVSDELQQLRARLLDMTSLLELELDFSDHEDIEFADRGRLQELLSDIEQHIGRLTESFRAGNAIRNGIAVAIIGPTNAGKSTLLNAIVGEDRAIISDIEGTTRDTIEQVYNLGGLRFRLIDTAGLRETEDRIEALGIQRTHRAMEQADIIIAVDCPSPTNVRGEVIAVHNKADLGRKEGAINISAKQGEIQMLTDRLVEIGTRMTQHTGNTLISNARHYEALCQAREALERVRGGMENGLSGELIAEDLRDVLDRIGQITGQVTNDEVLGNIFAKFCIGK